MLDALKGLFIIQGCILFGVSMTPKQIKSFLDGHAPHRSRTMVIVDFGNVEKWRASLGWVVGVDKVARLVQQLTTGAKYLRRFYYGEDYGPSETSVALVEFSRSMLEQAVAYGLRVVSKRVKYIHTENGELSKKCDLDVEMTVDLIKDRDSYDIAVIFSGDGDLAYAMRYLHDEYGKKFIVFGARDHVGRELIDALKDGIITHIFYAEDFEYRLSKYR